MPATKILRSRKARQASRSSLALECLESRLALAGNVTAQLVGSTLFLTGDALDNALVVASVPGGKMAVIGNGTTINGASTAVTPFVTSRAVTSIVANLGGGNDQIGFGNSAEGFANQLGSVGFTQSFSPSTLQGLINAVALPVTTFSLPGSLSVTTAAGDDAVGLIGNVGGSVAVNLGSASTRNAFVVGDTSSNAAVNRVGGGVAVVGGAQADVVLLYGTTVIGGVSAALGDGGSLFGVQAFGASFGSLAYTGGTGNDSVNLSDEALAIRNGANISTGAQGEDSVYLGGALIVGGTVVVNTGIGTDDDDVYVGADIRGALAVTTGAGADRAYVDNAKIGLGMSINSGAGDDRVIFSFARVGLNAVIDAGAGNDTVIIRSAQVRYNLFVYLGAGNDQLGIATSSALAAFLYGGTGTNSLTTNAATRAGIRTLQWFQFQTVNNT